ncbi:NAD(P)-binding protein [Thozetella sp. PMI_491]|nr:NAD(P)-binding protein [Thozetella sp. PMI_491]
MGSLTWLVTGATSGIGHELVQGIASRGDIAIATGRLAETRLASFASESIVPFDLDVTAPLEEIKLRISAAMQLFGRIDVLVNNAGIARPCTLEETSEKFMARLFDVNLFGAVKVTQAVLPHMRAAGGGKIGFVGTGFSWAPIPFTVQYSMAKAALSTFVEGLAKEVSSFNIRPVIFELGGFDTKKDKKASIEEEEQTVPPKVPEYMALFGNVIGGLMKEVWPNSPNDTTKLPDTLIDVLKGEGLAKGREVPVRVAIGPDTLDTMRQKCYEQLSLLDEWEDVTLAVMKQGKREQAPFLLQACSMKRL